MFADCMQYVSTANVRNPCRGRSLDVVNPVGSGTECGSQQHRSAAHIRLCNRSLSGTMSSTGMLSSQG